MSIAHGGHAHYLSIAVFASTAIAPVHPVNAVTLNVVT
jgi:hypothetical protein